MGYEIKVKSAKLDYYGGEVMKGRWLLELECGHKTVDRTRKDCKTYPKKEVFCGQCWTKNK